MKWGHPFGWPHHARVDVLSHTMTETARWEDASFVIRALTYLSFPDGRLAPRATTRELGPGG
jgi:hypothetical protein